MSEVSETIRAARKLIEKPENWCQGADARDVHGVSVDSTSPTAVGRCVAGALHAASASDYKYHAALDVLLAFTVTRNTGWIFAFNDHPDTTHAMVLDLFDRAIAMEEADG